MQSEPSDNYSLTINETDGYRPATNKDSTAASEEANDDNFLSSENHLSEPVAKEYKTTPWRWLILAVVMACTICQTMTVMSLAPVAMPVQEAFGLRSTIPVNLCAMSFSCCSIPMTFVAVWAFANYSTNRVLRSATSLQYFGAMFRLLSIVTG